MFCCVEPNPPKPVPVEVLVPPKSPPPEFVVVEEPKAGLAEPKPDDGWAVEPNPEGEVSVSVISGMVFNTGILNIMLNRTRHRI